MKEEEQKRVQAWRDASSEPLNQQLSTYIRPFIAHKLQIYLVANDKRKDVTIDLAIAEFLFRRGL